ncbi:lipid-binding SYLF domain-containing protein [Telluria beijingensis]|uniref:lipid-binding SYLF domain-containing protein n=1 Tax=Telluria beijingensis TaxID=3068633 RepID=UPI0027959FE2|nr:lipid-binding SYLF domain-containing protein [Massilia sp. REN29]
MNTSLPLPSTAVRSRQRGAPHPRTALCALLCAALPAFAQAPPSAAGAVAATDNQATQARSGATEAQRKQAAARHVDQAARVAQSMASAPKMAALLKRARGVYIVPHYGRAALAVGAEGGAGVLLVRRDDGGWSDPAFFNTGAIGVGLQAGAEEGPAALVLMNQRAVDHFRSKNNFSISADAGLTILTYARIAEGSTSGDIVAWSGAKGLFANALTVAVNDIRYNQPLTDAYYGKALSVRQIVERGESSGQAEPLRKALGGDGERTPAR